MDAELLEFDYIPSHMSGTSMYIYISFYILYIRGVLLQFYTVQVRGSVIAIHIGAVLLQDDNETKF